MASVTRGASSANRAMAGTTPLVETVIRRALKPARAVSTCSDSTVAS